MSSDWRLSIGGLRGSKVEAAQIGKFARTDSRFATCDLRLATCDLTVDFRLSTVDCRLLTLRPVSGDHVVQLSPLHRWDTPAIGAAAFRNITAVARLPALADATIPDDLNHRIVRERARQQLKGGEVATPNDDKSWLAHCRSR